MTIVPLWRRNPPHPGAPSHPDHPWDCPACAAYMTDLPPRPQGFAVNEPDTRPRWWESKGALNELEDPCGRPPMTTLSSDEKEATA